ncbi:MAG: lipoprotein insertase outer membrane protein LolB [Candidatus Competibacteraceae bacterium]|nr:lipoprotein insertase outer membrane protein LolB [Candidatus Competibacteraceae bacterium]
MRRLRQGLLLLAAVGLLLAGCTLPTRPLAEGPWESRRMALAALEDWRLDGRIGVIQGEEGWHGSLQWVQQGGHYRIDLIGPLGQGRAQIRGDPDGVLLQTAEGSASAEDPGRLVEQALGVDIPVVGLRYWVRGLPAPGQVDDLQGDKQGRLTRLEQDGWVIEYPRYQSVDGLELPASIRARRDDVQVKLAVGQWQL